MSNDHFAGKEAIAHVAEAQARGIVTKHEGHANELPGHLSALADAARDTAVLLALLWEIFNNLPITFPSALAATLLIAGSWILWKAGRSAWIGWSRLERLHRVVEEEKWEIDNHRKQEREELGVLYAAKGFEGKLLEDVLDVLMADGDRLLRVMVEEELGLSLEVYEHPLKQALGAAAGSAGACLIGLLCIYIYPAWGAVIAAAFTVSVAAAWAAKCEQNKMVPAIIWNLSLFALPLACVHFLSHYYFKG